MHHFWFQRLIFLVQDEHWNDQKVWIPRVYLASTCLQHQVQSNTATILDCFQYFVLFPCCFIYREISGHESTLPICLRRSSRLLETSPYGSFGQLPTELIYFILKYLPRNICSWCLVLYHLLKGFKSRSDKHRASWPNIKTYARHSHSLDEHDADARPLNLENIEG